MSLRTKPKLVRAESTRFLTNLYRVKIKEEFKNIYQYEIKLSIPDDSVELLRSVILSVKQNLKKKIGFLNFSGKLIYGCQENKVDFHFETKVGSSSNSIKAGVYYKKQIPLL